MWPVNMTGKTKGWPVNSQISSDTVRWPAVISSPDIINEETNANIRSNVRDIEV